MDPQNLTTPASPAQSPLNTLDEIRAHPKLVEDYSETERQVIKDNSDKLTDEEKWAFNPILGTSYTAPSANKEEETTTVPVTEPVKEPEVPASSTPAPQEPAPFTFKTQEEMDAYLDKRLAERETANKVVEPTTPVAPEAPKEFFDKDWKPQNANELAQAMLANPLFAEALKGVLAPRIKEDIDALNIEQRTAVIDFNKRLDIEYEEIATKNNLPALNTPEGMKINKELATLSLAHNKDNYHDAFALWSIIPKDKGGGLDVTITAEPVIETPATPTVDPAKVAIDKQKEAAGMVGAGSGVEANPADNNKPTQKELHDLSMDQLVDRAMKN